MDDSGNSLVTETPAKRRKTGGRKPGVPNRVTREIHELAGKYTARAVRMAWKIAKESGEDSTRLAAIKLLLGYGHGSPRTRTEITGADSGPVISRIERIIVDPEWGPPKDDDQPTGDGVPPETEAAPDSETIPTPSESRDFKIPDWKRAGR